MDLDPMLSVELTDVGADGDLGIDFGNTLGIVTSEHSSLDSSRILDSNLSSKNVSLYGTTYMVNGQRENTNGYVHSVGQMRGSPNHSYQPMTCVPSSPELESFARAVYSAQFAPHASPTTISDAKGNLRAVSGQQESTFSAASSTMESVLHPQVTQPNLIFSPSEARFPLSSQPHVPHNETYYHHHNSSSAAGAASSMGHNGSAFSDTSLASATVSASRKREASNLKRRKKMSKKKKAVDNRPAERPQPSIVLEETEARSSPPRPLVETPQPLVDRSGIHACSAGQNEHSQNGGGPSSTRPYVCATCNAIFAFYSALARHFDAEPNHGSILDYPPPRQPSVYHGRRSEGEIPPVSATLPEPKVSSCHDTRNIDSPRRRSTLPEVVPPVTMSLGMEFPSDLDQQSCVENSPDFPTTDVLTTPPHTRYSEDDEYCRQAKCAQSVAHIGTSTYTTFTKTPPPSSVGLKPRPPFGSPAASPRKVSGSNPVDMSLFGDVTQRYYRNGINFWKHSSGVYPAGYPFPLGSVSPPGTRPSPSLSPALGRTNSVPAPPTYRSYSSSLSPLTVQSNSLSRPWTSSSPTSAFPRLSPTPSGQITNGPLPNGHIHNGHMSNGHISNGPMSNGLPPNGHISSGHISNGPISNGHGHIPNGHISNGPISNCHPGRPPSMPQPAPSPPRLVPPLAPPSLYRASRIVTAGEFCVRRIYDSKGSEIFHFIEELACVCKAMGDTISQSVAVLETKELPTDYEMPEHVADIFGIPAGVYRLTQPIRNISETFCERLQAQLSPNKAGGDLSAPSPVATPRAQDEASSSPAAPSTASGDDQDSDANGPRSLPPPKDLNEASNQSFSGVDWEDVVSGVIRDSMQRQLGNLDMTLPSPTSASDPSNHHLNLPAYDAIVRDLNLQCTARPRSEL